MWTMIEWRCNLRQIFAIPVLAACAVLPGWSQAQEAKVAVAVGKALFERQFVAGEPINPGGDGLGPVFNHVSCVACHQQGGSGGSGPIDVNASMLSVDLVKLETAPEQNEFRRALKTTHAGFITPQGDIVPNVILHRFGVSADYNAIRQKFSAVQVPFKPNDDQRRVIQQTLARNAMQQVEAVRPLRISITQRNTPALFGAGQIDQIPDAALHALAKAQSGHAEVTGRVPPANLAKAGRFGWRGQIEHLHDFVLGACANELGLEVPGHPQPIDPLRPDYKAPALDLNAAQCLSLTSFVASLPAPEVRKPAEPDKLKAVEHGYKVFHNVGCAVCHVETIGLASGLYSDLLLHDLGPALADPVLAQPTMVQVDQMLSPTNARYEQEGRLIKDDVQTLVKPNPYYGGVSVQTVDYGTTYATDTGITTLVPSPKDKKLMIKTKYQPLPTNLAQEWRTPPLWGLKDSAPYLHDGRAATVIEAIALHGGEAEACTKRYFALAAGDRLALLAFLECLRAP